MKFFSSGQRTLLLLIRAYNERKNTDRACRLRFDRRLLQQCDLKTRKYTGSKRAGQNPSHRRMQRPDRTDLSRLPRRQKTRRVIKNVRLTPEVYDFTSDDGIRHEVWRIDKCQRSLTFLRFLRRFHICTLQTDITAQLLLSKSD